MEKLRTFAIKEIVQGKEHPVLRGTWDAPLLAELATDDRGRVYAGVPGKPGATEIYCSHSKTRGEEPCAEVFTEGQDLQTCIDGLDEPLCDCGSYAWFEAEGARLDKEIQELETALFAAKEAQWRVWQAKSNLKYEARLRVEKKQRRAKDNSRPCTELSGEELGYLGL
jgi:hypothetical protein